MNYGIGCYSPSVSKHLILGAFLLHSIGERAQQSVLVKMLKSRLSLCDRQMRIKDKKGGLKKAIDKD